MDGKLDGINDRNAGIIKWRVNGLPNSKMLDILSVLKKEIGLQYDVMDAGDALIFKYRMGYNEGMSHRNVELGGINIHDRIKQYLYR